MYRSIRTFLSLAIFSLSVEAAAFPDEQDPLLTEKSTVTFTVDMDGFPLTLPVELKNRTLPEKVSAEQTNLSIGSIDVAYEIKDEKTGKLTIVKSWVEFQGAGKSIRLWLLRQWSNLRSHQSWLSAPTRIFPPEAWPGVCQIF